MLREAEYWGQRARRHQATEHCHGAGDGQQQTLKVLESFSKTFQDQGKWELKLSCQVDARFLIFATIQRHNPLTPPIGKLHRDQLLSPKKVRTGNYEVEPTSIAG